MQLAERQKIYEEVAGLAELAAPKHRDQALKIIANVRERLNPDDRRQGPKSEVHRAKIAAAFEHRRQTEVFKIEYPELNNQSVEIVGRDNLVKLTGYTEASLRVRFSTTRGRVPFSYRGAALVAVRTSTFADAPDVGWKKKLDSLVDR